jgi:hypothetical protein
VYQGGEVSDGRRIYVGNINYDIREDEVRDKFTEVTRQPAIGHWQLLAPAVPIALMCMCCLMIGATCFC